MTDSPEHTSPPSQPDAAGNITQPAEPDKSQPPHQHGTGPEKPLMTIDPDALLEKTVLVVGGGMSGITAAVEAAETGCRVWLVERLPYIGGQVARMNEYFPKLCPPYCGLEINFRRIKNSRCIEVITSAQVCKIEGSAGDFRVGIQSEPEYVTGDCTACGDCTLVCPVETEDPFNYGMSKKKAIALPHELAFPEIYHIDAVACTGESCGKCVSACKYDAIKLDAEPVHREINVGTVLFCTGWEAYNPEKLGEYSWGLSGDIVNNVMMERMSAPNGPTQGKILKPSDSEPARRVAFVQCAGSRDENHLPYCSGVCCSASLKHALYYVEQHPENRADIYYIDLRVAGRNEDFLTRVEKHERIRLIKGKAAVSVMKTNPDSKTGPVTNAKPKSKAEPYPSSVADSKDRTDAGTIPVIEAEDILGGKKIREEYDLVVLASGIVPNTPQADLMIDSDGFIIKEALENGFSAGGCCTEPKDVAATVRESTGLVINVLQQNPENIHKEVRHQSQGTDIRKKKD